MYFWQILKKGGPDPINRYYKIRSISAQKLYESEFFFILITFRSNQYRIVLNIRGNCGHSVFQNLSDFRFFLNMYTCQHFWFCQIDLLFNLLSKSIIYCNIKYTNKWMKTFRDYYHPSFAISLQHVFPLWSHFVDDQVTDLLKWLGCWLAGQKKGKMSPKGLWGKVKVSIGDCWQTFEAKTGELSVLISVVNFYLCLY